MSPVWGVPTKVSCLLCAKYLNILVCNIKQIIVFPLKSIYVKIIRMLWPCNRWLAWKMSISLLLKTLSGSIWYHILDGLPWNFMIFWKHRCSSKVIIAVASFTDITIACTSTSHNQHVWIHLYWKLFCPFQTKYLSPSECYTNLYMTRICLCGKYIEPWKVNEITQLQKCL